MSCKNRVTGLPVLLSCILFFCGVSNCFAATSVWTVAKEGRMLYLVGTIHILGPTDYPLPVEYQHAYEASDLLVFEADVSLLQSPDALPMMQQLFYDDAHNLEQFLKPKTLASLKRYLDQRGLPEAQMLKMKPGMLNTTLMMLELAQLDQVAKGVDDHFLQQAIKKGKQTLFLEDALEQLSLLAGLGVGNEDAVVSYMLEELDQLGPLFSDMKKAWRKGDSDQFETLFLQPMREDYPAIYQDLLVKRNRAWLPKVKSMLETDEVEMILVGALHLYGSESLVAILRDDEYVVERL